MAVAAGLLGEVAFQGSIQVNARLVGQAHDDPQHIGQLVGQVQVVTRLARLVTIATSPTSSVSTAILVSSLK